VWWLQLIAVIGFAVLLAASVVAFRRRPPTSGQIGTIALFVVALVVLAVGVYLVVATA
jgi:hypothetical protein